MARDSISELKAQLEQKPQEKVRLELLSRIKDLVSAADLQIRSSQKEIVYGVREWTIEVIHSKYSQDLATDENELYIPDYQRGYKWNPRTASRFIESILLGFPVPYMYIADVQNEDDALDGRVEIIDGSQRIRALHYFLTDDQPLTELKELSKLEGFRFSDLSAGRQRRFFRESLRIVELKGEVNEGHRRDLFERINSGTKQLVPMEARHGSDAANSPFYKQLVEKCASNETFASLAPLSDAKRMNGDQRELVLRFFAYLNNFSSYSGTVAPFIDEYLEKSASDTKLNLDKYCGEFEQMLSFLETHAGKIGFRKTAKSRSTPRARYEAIAVGIAEALREVPSLDAPVCPFSDWLLGDEFHKIVSADSANNVSQVRKRIDYVKNKLVGE